MIKNRALAELVVELNGSQKDPQVKNVLDLCDILIQEAREANDDADSTEKMMNNQGEIRAYKKIKEFILRGLPGMQK